MIRFAITLVCAAIATLSALLRSRRTRAWHRERVRDADRDRALRAASNAHAVRVRLEGDGDWIHLGTYSLDRPSAPDKSPSFGVARDLVFSDLEGARFRIAAGEQ